MRNLATLIACIFIAVIKIYVNVKSVSWYPEENIFFLALLLAYAYVLSLITTGKEKPWGQFAFSDKYQFIYIFNVKIASVSLGTKC